jgi:hypothetical protein
MSATDWREVKYQDVYMGIMQSLEAQRLHDATFTPAAAEGILQHLYVLDGNDWLGRGDVGDIVSNATIAAYESFIASWKAESTASSKESSCP